ncbi:MAG: hypothetical protein GY834_16835 [Bacteroidetes bacterium]|nr:hypothetical protein [Bacteroidota bacterium]
MKNRWNLKILSILITGLLLFCHSIHLCKYENCVPITENSTEKKSSGSTKYNEHFGENEKDPTISNGLLKKQTRGSNKINFTLPIAYFTFLLNTHLNYDPRPPPITS